MEKAECVIIAAGEQYWQWKEPARDGADSGGPGAQNRGGPGHVPRAWATLGAFVVPIDDGSDARVQQWGPRLIESFAPFSVHEFGTPGRYPHDVRSHTMSMTDTERSGSTK